MAWRELRKTLERADAAGGLPEFDPQASPEDRKTALAAVWSFWEQTDRGGLPHPGPQTLLDSEFRPDRKRIEELRKVQDNSVVSIGE
jgi:hypothetical protein